MAITLITGIPGHGKTQWALWRTVQETKREARAVFHNGINGLNIPGWQVWKEEDWQQLPAGSLFIIDEAQKKMGVFGRGQVPQWVQDLATHRHLGLDILLMTQGPMLIDSFVRNLIERHFHIVRKFGTWYTTIHEYTTGCKDNVMKSRSGSIKHSWRFQKEVFDWYVSAEKHTVKRRIPARVWLLLAVPFIFAGLAFIAYKRLNPDAARDQVASVTGDGDAPGVSSPPGRASGSSSGRSGPMTLQEYAVAYRARVPGLAHTAPIYDEVTKPTAAPYPAACVSMKGQCRCYSQQATKLDVAADVCEQIVAGGYFVAWGQPVVPAVPITSAASSPAPTGGPAGQVVALAAPAVGINAGGAVPGRELTPVDQVPPDLGAPPRVRAQPRGTGS